MIPPVDVTTAQAGRTGAPSIKDVARLAGVSGQTVSRVSTGSESVRPETRERVLKAMEQLGYSPNKAARALRFGRHDTLGILAQRFDRTGEAMTTDAVLRAAAAADLGVTLLSVEDTEAGWDPAAGRLVHQTIDGLILLRAEGDADVQLALPPGFPIVVSDSRMRGTYPCVTIDSISNVRPAVDYLLNLGHRTVHHITGPLNSEPARIRALGWRVSLEERGREVPAPLVGDWTAESGYAHGLTLAADPSVTAVFCANDEQAFGLLQALRETGRDVPGDVSVIGYDGIALGTFAAPALTTLRADFSRVGYEMVRVLTEQIQGTAGPEPASVLVSTELVIRSSTGPAPSS